MWFKNLRCYAFSDSFTLADNFDVLLAEQAFRPCGRTEVTSFGWVSPFAANRHGAEPAAAPVFSHRIGDNVLLCARKEEKVLPNSAVQAQLDEKIEAIQAETGRVVGRKEKQSLKEDLVHAMLPQAFSKYQVTWLFISLAQQVIFVDAASANRAEDALALLRGSIGSLPVKPLLAEQPLEGLLTEWLRTQQLPDGLVFGDEIELRAAAVKGDDAPAVIRCRQQDLSSEEMQIHLAHDKQVTKLGLIWRDRLSFVLDTDVVCKRVQMTDVLADSRDDLVDPSAEQKLDADFALLAGELNALYPELCQWLAEHA